jgi:segregation and condensation protein A
MEPNENPISESPALEESGITIRLGSFEGPLDLLLHLIKKEEVDIWNIPIARITEQYLEHLQIMKDLNINVAGEWLVMAATLIYIKSRMLLPPEPTSESLEAEEDPRSELVYQLLEHQKFKNAAQMLLTRQEVENAIWSNPAGEFVESGEEVISVSLFDLLRAFHEIVQRFEEQRRLEVPQEDISIEDKIADIRGLLLVHDTILFSNLLMQARSKRHLIVTFLALLELVRLHEVWLYQRKAFDEIFITKGKSTGD